MCLVQGHPQEHLTSGESWGQDWELLSAEELKSFLQITHRMKGAISSFPGEGAKSPPQAAIGYLPENGSSIWKT